MPPWISIRLDRDPVRMRHLRVLVRSVRIGTNQHRHTQLATTRDEFAQNIPVIEPCAAMMKRNLRRIVCNAAPAAEAHAVGACPLEVVEPERRIEVSGVVFHQSELRPAHRLRGPRWIDCGTNTQHSFAPKCRRKVCESYATSSNRSGLQKLSTCYRGWAHARNGT